MKCKAQRSQMGNRDGSIAAGKFAGDESRYGVSQSVVWAIDLLEILLLI